MVASAVEIAESSKWVLLLDGADQRALDEVFLQEGVDHQNRESGDDDCGVLDRLAELKGVAAGDASGHTLDVTGDQDFAEDELEWIQIPDADIDQRVEVCVPVANGIEEDDYGERWQGQRQHDAKQDGEVVRSVDAGCFFK